MEEQYELVSKSTLKQLRDENKRLKEELAQKPKEIVQKEPTTSKEPIEKHLKELFAEFEKKQENIFKKEFEEIKELNKSTLNNVLNNSQNLNSKLGGIIETMQHLVENLSTLLEEVSHNNNSQQQESGSQEIEDIGNIKELLSNTLDALDSPQQQEILSKLIEIETFMENLKTLLAQIKPSDMSISRN